MNVHDQILTIHVVIDFSENHIEKYEWVFKMRGLIMRTHFGFCDLPS